MSDFDNVWKRITKHTDELAEMKTEQALIAQSLGRHLDDCERQHRENREDREAFKKELQATFDNYKQQIEALAVSQTAMTTAMVDRKGILEQWCAGWSPRARLFVTIIIIGGALATAGISIKDVLTGVPTELIGVPTP